MSQEWKPTQAQEAHLENLFIRLNMPQEGRVFVNETIRLSPCRPVDNHRGNVMFKFMSGKNHRPMELESRSGEYPQAILLENDPDVVMWLCQAPQQTLDFKRPDGTRYARTPYTLDFLVVRKDKIVAIETRDESVLTALYAKNPEQFHYDGKSDRWSYRAAEDHFAAMGIEFQLIANRQIDSTLVNNTRFLEDFLSDKAEAIDDLALQRLRNALASEKRISYFRAIDDYKLTADQVLYAIANQLVYVDLTTDRVDRADALSIYENKQVREVFRVKELQELGPIEPIPGSMHLRTGTRFVLQGREHYVVLCGERDIEVRDSDGNARTFSIDFLKMAFDRKEIEVDGIMPAAGARALADCSELELTDALRRLNAMDKNDTSFYSERSLSRYRLKTENIPTRFGKLMALVDQVRNRGHRRPRFTEADEELISKAIEEKYNQPEGCSLTKAFSDYNDLCQAYESNHPEKPKPTRVSFTTFCLRARVQGDVVARKGKRIGYQQKPIISTVSDPYPVHGVRPHEICYIDHTTMNLALTSGQEEIDLGKAYLSVAQDGYTTQARALILTYDPPSTTTVLLILRDYVRRYKRLPTMLSLDNAKEFRGSGLRAFCEMFGIDLRFRAPGQPRGGAPVESLIGAIEKEVVSGMKGNTILLKNARLVTKSVNGFNRAEHTLISAYKIIEQYLFVDRNERPHPTLNKTPNELELEGFANCGERLHTYVRYDDNLMLATSPFATRVLHLVCPRRGVWVDNMWYRHPQLRGLPKDTKVRVRIEPFASRVVYVEVKGRWHAAVGRNSRVMDGRTVRETEMARRKNAKEAANNSRKTRIYGGTKDGNPRSLRPEDYDHRLRAQQAEVKELLNQLGLLGAIKVDPDLLDGEEAFDIMRAPELSPAREANKTEPAVTQPPPEPTATPMAAAPVVQPMAAANQENMSEAPTRTLVTTGFF
ncbi:DDE-type integrase/transposase/recombinase [Roseateles violae]|uniref:DDE-type integrase/transposase/recombinase n=1 Tax=Roseateles violae TaxID=3058042 RepID=A0ABT8DN70_9BURK|nr:DDE-type integrase/transposase/recombinase [Pelomonas sp. PFR6]MDN3919403.1 DDE-type integrase/transposase/recombinase [Pelomonas sp. PFR6]